MKKIVLVLLIMMSPIWAQFSIYGGLQSMSASGDYIQEGESVIGLSVGAAYGINDKLVVGAGISERGFSDTATWTIDGVIIDLEEEHSWTAITVWCAYTLYSTDRISLWVGPIYAALTSQDTEVTDVNSGSSVTADRDFDGGDLALMLGISTPVGESMAIHIGYQYGISTMEQTLLVENNEFSLNQLFVNMSYGF